MEEGKVNPEEQVIVAFDASTLNLNSGWEEEEEEEEKENEKEEKKRKKRNNCSPLRKDLG